MALVHIKRHKETLCTLGYEAARYDRQNTTLNLFFFSFIFVFSFVYFFSHSVYNLAILTITSTMADTTPGPSSYTYNVESKHAIEARITQAIEILQERGGQPNFAPAARVFCCQCSAFEQDGMAANQSFKVLAGNRKLSQHQELGVCEYF